MARSLVIVAAAGLAAGVFLTARTPPPPPAGAAGKGAPPPAGAPAKPVPGAGGGAAAPRIGLVEMTVLSVMVRDESPVVVLRREPDRKRVLPIFVGVAEALAIIQEMRGDRPPRPMTHDLLGNVIRRLGGKVARVVVNDLRDGTFFAQIVIERDGGEILVDSRPSDSIALALRHGAKILVEPRVLEEAGADADGAAESAPAAGPRKGPDPAAGPPREPLPADAI